MKLIFSEYGTVKNKMKKLFKGINIIGFIIMGVGIGIRLSIYLIQREKCDFFSLYISADFILLFSQILIFVNYKTRQEKEEMKEKAIKRYENMIAKYGETNLKRISVIGFTIVALGFITMFISIPFVSNNSYMYLITLIIIFIGLFIVGYFGNLEKKLNDQGDNNENN